jgi:ATP-dependent DNA helicase RecQ
VKQLRDWDALVAVSKKRRTTAKVVLEAILSRIPADAPASAEHLTSFSTEDLVKAIRSHLFLSQEIKDPLAAVDRGLLYLHEQKVIILQQGLAVFRQAMSIKILPDSRKGRYLKGDYEPLEQHYRERIFQVHVVNEYARLGVEKVRKALELVLAYFSMDRVSFIKRFFPGRKEMLERATAQESFQRIVDHLANPVQMAVVAAPEYSNMLVLAGPGSGKTRVVVHRCAYLLRVLRVPPRSVLVLCFNHYAAVELRRRLCELVGNDAKGVTIQTYHGLAMRLTGTSFAELAERSRGEEFPFDDLIPEAIRLLRGDSDLPGLTPDEARDRLLAGFRHILVDEYQDIDSKQYDLVSAIAGRLERDPDSRLTIMAVGDDDQNIYTFRGTNVELIRRFQQDYDARIHHLTENYRSTSNIIAAANALIRHNRDRMKVEYPIRINRGRERQHPGGRIGDRDPLTEGRVQVLDAANAGEQAAAIITECKRLKEINPDLQWSDIAILARKRETLSPIRAACEHFGIPVAWALSRKKSPPLHRVREIAELLDGLKEHRKSILRASEIENMLDAPEHAAQPDKNPWRRLLRELLASWREETSDAALPVPQAIEALYDALAERRREQRLGQGVFLGTIHGAKGMEFPHVFLCDGDWPTRKEKAEMEEERRTFYVGMTRARDSLTLFRRADAPNPHLPLIRGDFLLERKGPVPPEPTLSVPLSLRYDTLGLGDVHLGFAGRYPESAPVHRRLSALGPGSLLSLRASGGAMELLDAYGHKVGTLSRKAAGEWTDRIDRIKTVRILAMVRREQTDETEEFQSSCRCPRWEVPWLEVIWEPPLLHPSSLHDKDCTKHDKN